MASEAKKILCILCSQASQLMCQRCGEQYCSEVCQRLDWQRHKYICTSMPRLVKLDAATIARHEYFPTSVGAQTLHRQNVGVESMMVSLTIAEPPMISNNSEASGVDAHALSSAKVKPKPSSLWREHYLPPSNEYIDCRVSCMERDDTIWVVDVANSERLERLTESIARAMQNKQPCSLSELSVSDLVCVAIDMKMYRAEVISLNGDDSCIEVRLIDYGPVVKCSLKRVYWPSHRIGDFKAFAFKVELPANTDVQINKNITLRLLGTTSHAGIQQARLKPNLTIPLHLPLDILAANPEVKVVNILEHNEMLKEPQVALLQMVGVSNFNEDLNARLAEKPGQKLTGPFPDEVHPFFLAAKTKQGYRRAFVLDYNEESSLFLVYEMDEGRISMTNDVRRIPSELMVQPIHVFAITLLDGQPRSLLEELQISGRDLCIKFPAEASGSKEHEKLNTSNATLLLHNDQECAVRATNFLGVVKKIGLKYWRQPIENGSMVYIAHYVDYQEICIRSVATKHYEDLFKRLYSKCRPFKEASNVDMGSLVLVESADHGYYRAEIIGIEISKFSVYDIDSGSEYQVTLDNLRKPCRFVKRLPVSHLRAKINTICNIPAYAVPSNTVALQLLMKLCNQKTEMQVKFTDSDCSTLDLIDFTTEPQSLMTRMLPMLFTPAAVELEPAQNLPSMPITPPEPYISKASEMKTKPTLPDFPPSPPKSPVPIASVAVKRYYFNDIERRLIPPKQNTEILVLNAIGLHKLGYVTACSFYNEKQVEDYQNMLYKVAENGTNNKDLLPGYLPDVGEMCLVFFTEENSWYRGVCLKVNGQKVQVMYTDFGNEETVPIEYIKSIPQTLLFGTHATKCFIDGFDVSKDFTVLEEFLSFKGKILCTVLEGPEPNTRLLNIPNLDKILSKELI